jgi:hypothetical protein
MNAGRQAEGSLSFLLEVQVQRRQSRAEAERSCLPNETSLEMLPCPVPEQNLAE